jgi:uncharacterized membrane protein YhaH (DUF805 family)
MSPRTQLVFTGELTAGFALDEARRNMAGQFNLNEQQLAQMFGSGKEVVLKRHLEEGDALRYVRLLAGLGLKVQARPMPDAPGNTTTSAALLSTSMPLAPYSTSTHAWEHADTIPLEQMVALRPAPSGRPPAEPPFQPTDTSDTEALPVTEPSPLTMAEGDAEEAMEVRCPSCGERQPMRVLCRKCATNLEMALKAKAENEEYAKAERLDAARARRGLPPAGRGKSGFGASGHASSILQGTEATTDVEAPPLWAGGWEGRIGRLNFATGMFVLWGGLILSVLLTSAIPETPRGVFNFLILVLLTIMFFRLAALRLHDRDHSGWWNLLMVAPFVLVAVMFFSPLLGAFLSGLAVLMTIPVYIYLLFFPGNDGSNAYGEPPREGSVPALLASVVALVVLTMVAPRESLLAAPGVSSGSPREPGRITPKSEDAQLAFATEYRVADKHKAFAASPDGSWGWKSEVASTDIAMSEAMATCEKHRPLSQRPCVLIDVNGKPVPRN